MVAPTPAITMLDTEQEREASPFCQKLKTIEDNARAVIAQWTPDLLGQATGIQAETSASGTKRKASEMDSDTSDDDSDSGSDDDDDMVPPYNPDSQQRPKLPIYHPGFKLTEELIQGIVATFLDFIRVARANGYNDDESNILWNEIVRCKEIPYQDAVRLAVAGDTGAGKSALLNAIMGVDNLTIEGDEGGACTCVITEFSQSPPTQTAPFAAEVEFFCLDVCRKLVTDLFSQWFRVKQKQRQNPEDVDDEDTSQMSTARTCLNDMFADRLGFESAEAFMSTATSADDPKVLGQFLKWTTDIHQMFVQDGETSVTFEASTPATLVEQYHPFTRAISVANFKGKPMRFSPWPVVKVIRVTLNSPLLQQDIIISDIPGASDVNYFRIDNAKRHLQSCDITIVVGKIDRVVDNVSFTRQYIEAYRRRRSGSVILVATRSDDLNDEGGSKPSTDTEDLALIAEKITEVGHKIQLIKHEMDHNKLHKNAKANKTLKKQKNKLTKRTEALVKQRRNIRMAMRNKRVGQGLEEGYRSNTKDDAGASAYCVSNRMYMRHIRGFDKTNEGKAPSMSREETQIPALCESIYILPSKGKTASLDHFVRNTVPTLLSIIQTSCSTTTLTRVNHLTSIVKKSRRRLEQRIDELALKFRATDIKLLHDRLSDHVLQTMFDKNALKWLGKWETLVCIYAQKKKGINMNWNENLMSAVRPTIDVTFRTLIDENCDTFKAEAAQASKDTLRELDHMLKNDPKALACEAYKICFKDNLARFDEEINRQVDMAAKHLRDSLIKTHLESTRLSEDDYFPDAMREFYEKAVKTPTAGKGVTMMAARCRYLREAIPGPTGPFSEIAGWAKEDVQEAVNNFSEEFKKGVDDIFVKVQNAFERMKKRKENDSPEGKKFRTELHQLVAEAKRILEGVTRESLELCKQYK
ncbi:hypothetical protein P153DRAFT_375119 [Dothidotthia symphoricarpi CBS 119687]|uniref:Dynamin N-terminal domain-containing protein n=1 Tax=Dothidotthia symphoricarpi CBS 119687 TaxID=1392245 RepID=A0A6A6AHF9_9PLEO|nr:uncharacterized protein P153DRAFT_375119 [Dothidotthia symphoricarpi CBS 119687]KAF2130344.1 hypothetical protein P153DRAFT_375119 [Dothidotthia symphoricarpi CBS 119687]